MKVAKAKKAAPRVPGADSPIKAIVKVAALPPKIRKSKWQRAVDEIAEAATKGEVYEIEIDEQINTKNGVMGLRIYAKEVGLVIYSRVVDGVSRIFAQLEK